MTPVTRPGRCPVTIRNQKPASVGIVIVLLLLFLLPIPAPRSAWATPFGLHPASVLARLAAGAGAAGVALDLPLAERLYGLQRHQGYGFAHVLTRSVLAFGCAPHAASGRALDTTSSRKPKPWPRSRRAACLRPADDGSRGWCGPQPVGRGLGPLTRQERPKPPVWGAVEGSEAHRPPAPLTTEGDSLPSLARGGGN